MQAYKNDPTIMSWNLINEPRCDKPNCAGLVQSWIEKQSAYLKTVDPNHLVTVGEPHRAMTLPINASGAVQHALSSSSLVLGLHDSKVRTAQHPRQDSAASSSRAQCICVSATAGRCCSLWCVQPSSWATHASPHAG